MNINIQVSDFEYIKQDLRDEMEMLRGTTILITGFCGFIGYYLLSYFLKFANEYHLTVIAVDNNTEMCEQWREKYNGDPHLKIHTIDVSCIKTESIPGIETVGYIYHMASIASPTQYRKKPMETLLANIDGLRAIGDLVLSGKMPLLRRIVYMSSSEIYGDPDDKNIPTKETFFGNVSCSGPRACYDESKRVCETICWIYANQFHIPVSIVRPFNVYGPGLNTDDGRVSADFAKAIISGDDIIIYSDGSATRTFCYITDAIIGLIKVCCHMENDVFNIGQSGPEISIYYLAQIYRKIGIMHFDYRGIIKSKVHYDCNYLTNNPRRRCPDISKARNLLRYNPSIQIEDGVLRYLSFLKG